MSNEELREVHTYLAPTRFSARTGIVLGRRLLSAAPADLNEKEESARAWMEETTKQLYERTKERLDASPAVLVDLSRAMARAWVGVRMRLEGFARCTDEEEALEVEALLAAVLPRGTRFVTNNYDESYTTSAQLLDRIAEQGLEEAVARHVHPGFMARMRRLHARFEEGFGVGDTPLSPKTGVLSKDIREHADAISNWSRTMAARIDPNDAATIEAFFAVMEPLRLHRSLLSAGRSSEDEDEGVGDEEISLLDTDPGMPALPAEGTAATG